MDLRINIGCGQTPTQGWRNFDNSFSLHLSKIPIVPYLLNKFGVLDNSQYKFIQFARKNRIEYGDAAKGLPIKSESVDVIYTSHMLEHLDTIEADKFLAEAFRLLRPGGIIRIVVPDIRKQIEHYMETGDANSFIAQTHLSAPRPRSISQRLRLLLVGNRNHQWMYDGASLSALLKKHGFTNTEVLRPGETKIHDYEPLDLTERVSESVYVEAKKPAK